MVHLSIVTHQQRPSRDIYGSFCDPSVVQNIEGVDGHQTALTSNRIIQGWLLVMVILMLQKASSVLSLELFKVYFCWSCTLRRGLKVIFVLMTCSPEIKTLPYEEGCCNDFTGSMIKKDLACLFLEYYKITHINILATPRNITNFS